MLLPALPSAASCAALSMPQAMPETTVMPQEEKAPAICPARACPRGVALREPMTAMNAAAGTPDEERLRKVICELFLLNDKGEDYIGDENKFDYWD